MKKSLLISVIALSFVSNSFAQSTHHPHSASKAITGMTTAGGNGGYGATYYYDPATGNDSLLFSFSGNGSSVFLGEPHGNVIQASNGKIYGMGSVGGNFNYGGVFCFDPATGKDTIVFSFNFANGNKPIGSLIQASDGLLYGTTSIGGATNYGVIFSYNTTTGKETTVLTFDGTDGANPCGSLMQATDGLLYGMTSSGGASNLGTVFSFNTVTGKDSMLISFNNTNGSRPSGSLIQASDGLLYGMTNTGGLNSIGVIFSYNTLSGKDSVLLSFNTTNGSNPDGSLVQASNGLLYGMTAWGGSLDYGVCFSYNISTGQDSILFNFNFNNGGNPLGSLVQASDGLLYGMTNIGGTNGDGVIFNYNPTTGLDSVLVSLSGLSNGDKADGDVYQATDGFLYGMTSGGGSVGAGVLFKFNRVTLKDSVLLNCGTDQYYTLNSPMQASNGLLYGMTVSGGTSDYGSLFSYNPSTGKDSLLLNFNYTNGASPYGSFIQGIDGLLYGMTSSAMYYGNLFSYNPATGQDSVRFYFNGTNGETPYGSLIQASDGLLYGMTSAGGSYTDGVLFSFNPVTGYDSVLVNFNDTNGNLPIGTLTQAADGLLYGTTNTGGLYGTGVIFSYDVKKGIYDTLISLNYNLGNPEGNLIVDTTLHVIYGTSNNGGANSVGALFSFNMNTKKLDTLVNFNVTNGYFPTGLLMWDTAANLIYSTTYLGGAYNYGVLYMYNVAKGTDTTLVNFHDSLALTHGRLLHGKKGYAGALGTNPCGILLTKGSVITEVNSVDEKKNEAITVYPNPSSGIFSIEVKSEELRTKSTVEVYNVLGEKVYSQSSILNSTFSINLKDSPAGVYFVRAYDEGQKNIATAKIIIE